MIAVQLQPYQAIALLNVAAPKADAWTKLKNYVLQGGGLAVVPGGQAETDRHAYNDNADAQAILPDGVTLQAAFASGADPRLTISRLLCPRRLSPDTWYIAAVVPAFEVGRDQPGRQRRDTRLTSDGPGLRRSRQSSPGDQHAKILSLPKRETCPVGQ